MLGETVDRRVVFANPNSFIDAVSRALGNKEFIEDEKKRVKYLKDIRKNCMPEICAQENYDFQITPNGFEIVICILNQVDFLEHWIIISNVIFICLNAL